MGFLTIFTESTMARYVRAIRAAPPELIYNRHLIYTAAVFAMSGIPITWDQGSSSVVPSLPGFQRMFGITSGANPQQITNFVSLVYVGCGIGAAVSYFVNDRIGRLWSFRLYTFVWFVGQMIATGSNGSLAALCTARIVSGLGIGALTVTGPISLVEIAPTELRGLITVWFSVAMLMSLFVSVFCVYGVFIHVAASALQYQIVFFSPCIYMMLICGLSFLCCESPRWLCLVGKDEEAAYQLTALRGLGLDHARIQSELEEIHITVRKIRGEGGQGTKAPWATFKATLEETFLVKANLRRVQQAFISYALAQLSGANSVTSYFVPILKLMGESGDQTHSLFLTGMYSMAKFFFTLIASFFFIDALGRRRSLFIGITIQMISDLYIGVYIRYRQLGAVSDSASEAAVALIFLHGFGYSVGLLVLPYVFGAEIWPNHIRSFGSALSQTWHWLFYFGVSRGMPSLLAHTHNWGAFIFFAAWCFVSLLYVFLVVPETAGQSLEAMNQLFEAPWYMAFRSSQKSQHRIQVIEGESRDVRSDESVTTSTKGEAEARLQEV
ncbi:putative sugar transporter [Polychaeton citri CBS 116435]|uniref:Sugar transporter n=1 Tax=Polychaeton citri CBS 116435 TaxID=1314669 RepID=A0A9P4UTD0_9PEZI|nr:putative sugar transporter [Polychaeton citri CBS 116435]